MARTCKSSKNKIETRQPEKTVLWQVAFWGLAVLLFLPPFFRGLFFAPEQRIALIFAVLIFWLVWMWKWVCKDSSFLTHPLDYFMLALPVVYIISAFNAVNYGLSIDEIVKVILYFIVYWIVVQLIRSRKDAEMLLYVIYVAAVGIALAGLMTATGLINIEDGMMNGRLASYLQYPNALASYMAAVLLLGVYLWWRNTHLPGENVVQNKKLRFSTYISFLIAAGNCLLTAVFIGAKSNGGFIVFSLAVLLLLAFLPGISRIYAFFHLAMIAVSSLGSMYLFLLNIKSQQYTKAWLFILAGVLLAAGLQWVFSRYLSEILKRKISLRMLLMGGALVLTLMALTLSLAGSDMITSLSGKFKVQSFMHRVYFVEDAFNMIKERPLLGWGGGGWQEAYQFFQSYSYTSRQVHSHYLQVAVETGITGLLAMVGIWAAYLFTAYRSYRTSQNYNDRIFIAFLAVSILVFGIHAAADFDLSLSALSLVLYTLMAMLRVMDNGFAGDNVKPGTKKRTAIATFITAPATGLIIVLLAGCLIAGYNSTIDASAYLGQKDLKKAIAALERATAYDPFRAEYHAKLAELYSYAGQDDKSANEMSAVLARSKYNPDIRIGLSKVVLQQGKFSESVYYAEEAIKMAPWHIPYYEFAGNVYIYAGLEEMKNNRSQVTEHYFLSAAKLPERIENKGKSLDPSRQAYNYFTVTPKVAVAAGIADLNVGNIQEAHKYLTIAAGNEETMDEANTWLKKLSEREKS